MDTNKKSIDIEIELIKLLEQAELVTDDADKIARATKAFRLINQILETQWEE
jgi:hypothetical protein